MSVFGHAIDKELKNHDSSKAEVSDEDRLQKYGGGSNLHNLPHFVFGLGYRSGSFMGQAKITI